MIKNRNQKGGQKRGEERKEESKQRGANRKTSGGRDSDMIQDLREQYPHSIKKRSTYNQEPVQGRRGEAKGGNRRVQAGRSLSPVRGRAEEKTRGKRRAKTSSRMGNYLEHRKLTLELIRNNMRADEMSFAIPKTQFSREVKELMDESCELLGYRKFKMTGRAMGTLQAATEDWVADYLGDISLIAGHAKRVTIMAKDFRLAKRIRGDI